MGDTDESIMEMTWSGECGGIKSAGIHDDIAIAKSSKISIDGEFFSVGEVGTVGGRRVEYSYR